MMHHTHRGSKRIYLSMNAPPTYNVEIEKPDTH